MVVENLPAMRGVVFFPLSRFGRSAGRNMCEDVTTLFGWSDERKCCVFEVV